MPYNPLDFEEDYAGPNTTPSAPPIPTEVDGPVNNPTPAGTQPAPSTSTTPSQTQPSTYSPNEGEGAFTQTAPGAGDGDGLPHTRYGAIGQQPPQSPTAPTTPTTVTETPTDSGRPKRDKTAATTAAPGGGGGGTRSTAIEFPDAEFDGRIKSFIDDLMSGKISQYSPDTLDYIRTDLVRNRERAKETARETIYSDAARRGMFRSGQTSARVDSAIREADATYSKDWTQVLIDKARSDVQMKLAGLERAQDWLNSRRQFILGKESNETQRKLGEAQIALGYARIAAEKEMMEMQLSRMGGGGGERSFTITNEDGTTSDIPEWLMELILRS